MRFVASLGSFYLVNATMFHTFAGRVAPVESLGDFGQITLTLAAVNGFAVGYFSSRFEDKLQKWTASLAAGTSGWFLYKVVLMCFN